MAVSKITYSTSTAITISLASLANLSARESTVIDNSSNLYLDAIVYLALDLNTGTPSQDQAFNIYFYGSEDGTNYTDNATGSDAPITLRSPTNLRGPFIIATPTSGGLVYKAVIGSVASYFGGVLPRKWGIVVENRCGVTLSGTEGNHIKSYTGLTITST